MIFRLSLRFKTIFSFPLCKSFYDAKDWELPFDNFRKFIHGTVTVRPQLLLFTTFLSLLLMCRTSLKFFGWHQLLGFIYWQSLLHGHLSKQYVISGKSTTHRVPIESRRIEFCDFGSIKHIAVSTKRTEEFSLYM